MRPQTNAVDPLAALRRYQLDAPAVLGREDVGIINDNWLITDARGERYVLRAYRRVTDVQRIEFQLAFQEHLLANGFPTAPVIKTRSGEPFASVDGLHWALLGFVEGEEFDFTRPAQAREAGRRLAQFEAVAAGYAGPVVAPPVREVDFGKWLAPVSSHVWQTSVLDAEHEEQLHELFSGAGLDQELAFFSQWRRDAAAAWPQERLGALPEAWLHCDYHGRNMVFQGDDMAGLFDFDFLTQGPRTFDIARAVFNFGRERRASATLREEFCRVFLDGFESIEPLTAEEWLALPAMAVLNWVPYAAFYVARREEGDYDIAKRFRLDVAMMRAMQAQMDRLAPQFGWPRL